MSKKLTVVFFIIMAIAGVFAGFRFEKKITEYEANKLADARWEGYRAGVKRGWIEAKGIASIHFKDCEQSRLFVREAKKIWVGMGLPAENTPLEELFIKGGGCK